jgi:hypothetical protein
MLSQLDGPAVKVANKQLSVTNLQALIDKIDNPDGNGLKASTIQKAMREIQILGRHPNATDAQKTKFANLTAMLQNLLSKATANKMSGEYRAIGWAPLPGLPTSIYFQDQNPVAVVPNAVWKGTDTTQTPNRIFWYWGSPLGFFQSHGYPVPETQSLDQDALATIFNEVFTAIPGWIQSQGFSGSGNVQTAENKTGWSGFNLAANSSDGYGGYLNGLVRASDFINIITNPSFQIHNASTNPLQKLAKDVSTAAKAVAKEATTIAKGVEHVVALVGAAPARLAAIELIKSNDMNLATMLAQAWQKDKTKVSNFWYTFGGSPSELVGAINQGAKTSLSGESDYMSTSIGDVAPTPKSATASAIVNAIMDFLKAMGIPIPAALQATVNTWLDKAATILKQGATTLAIVAHNIDGTAPNAGVYKQTMAPASKGASPILLVGAAAVLGFIVLSKNS